MTYLAQTFFDVKSKKKFKEKFNDFIEQQSNTIFFVGSILFFTLAISGLTYLTYIDGEQHKEKAQQQTLIESNPLTEKYIEKLILDGGDKVETIYYLKIGSSEYEVSQSVYNSFGIGDYISVYVDGNGNLHFYK